MVLGNAGFKLAGSVGSGVFYSTKKCTISRLFGVSCFFPVTGIQRQSEKTKTNTNKKLLK